MSNSNIKVAFTEVKVIYSNKSLVNFEFGNQ